jgi:hypothetical protein
MSKGMSTPESETKDVETDQAVQGLNWDQNFKDSDFGSLPSCKDGPLSRNISITGNEAW